jgi:Trk K+ transport system NAD-binding subunit
MDSKARLRYKFDNAMARGVGAQILLLAVITIALVVVASVATVVFGAYPEDDGSRDSFGLMLWKSLMHSLDPGTLGGDPINWGALVIMLIVTIGGIFVLSALIGVLNQGFGEMLDNLRRGKSAVVERGHTVILGWDPKIFTLLSELAEANHNQRNACVVVLADRDKVEMDAEIATALDGSRLRVVTRRGSAMSMEDLALVALDASKAVIVLAPNHQSDGTPVTASESDTMVLKALLAISKLHGEHPLHIVAEIRDPRTEPVARMVVGDSAALIQAGPLISRLLVQTGRQSGLSIVYTELLDFAGVEIYVTPQPELVGSTFREAVFRYDGSTLIGVRSAAGEIQVPPPLDRRFEAGDQVVTISEDDDTILLNGSPRPDHPAILPVQPEQPADPERILILGTSPRLPVVLRELDAYTADGSEALVLGEGDPAAVVAEVADALKHLSVTVRAGDVTDPGVLESADVPSFDHVLVLSETEGRTQEMADARTTVALLYLRDLQRRSGKVPITSEMLEVQNRALAAVSEADDFIVSNTLVSLVVSQVAENPHLFEVFNELFTSGGHELYLRPATDLVRPGRISYAVVCEAALRRNEIAVGYRLAATARDADQTFGVVVNPSKRTELTLGAEDRIIVLADN